MRTNMNFWPAKRMLCLALCILMLVGIAMPSLDAFIWDGRESLLSRLFGVAKAYAAETDVTAWNTCGTCEWGIDPDGCLWIRPTNGVNGTLANWTSNPPWYSQRGSVKSVVVKSGVSAKTCGNTFSNMNNCTSIDLNSLITSDVTNMAAMFRNCSALTSLDVTGLDTSKVAKMNYMFDGCSKLVNLDVSGFDTSNVTNMGSMFYECRSINDVEIFYNKNLKDHPLGSRMKTILFHRNLDAFSQLITCLTSISKDQDFIDRMNGISKTTVPQYQARMLPEYDIFLSALDSGRRVSLCAGPLTS